MKTVYNFNKRILKSHKKTGITTFKNTKIVHKKNLSHPI